MTFDRVQRNVRRRTGLVLAGLGFTLALGSADAADAREISVAAGESVQAAIERALDGDRIVVQPGTYRELIDFRGKAIELASAAGPEVTVLDGGGLDTVVRLVSGERQNTVLRGFTITGGVARESGGGIQVRNGNPTIVGNVITGNRAPSGGGGAGGGGIALTFSSPLIQDNRIIDNEATGDGGGIYVLGDSQALIVRNEIADNTAASGGGVALFFSGRTRIQYSTLRGNRATSVTSAGGGGISVVGRSFAEISGNLVIGNAAPIGGGISWQLPENVLGPLLVNNTVADNDSPMGSAVAANELGTSALLLSNLLIAPGDQTALLCISVNQLFDPSFFFNDIYSPRGSAVAGICSPTLAETFENQSVDPRFVDAAHGDYRLSASSPAIDAGDFLARALPNADLDRNPRLFDANGDGEAIVDQGAYELGSSATR